MKKPITAIPPNVSVLNTLLVITSDAPIPKNIGYECATITNKANIILI